jgi:succinate-acetate transporter protein
MATNQNLNAELKIAQQQLPPRANPAPLGLAGFGLTTVMLSCINAGLMPPDSLSAVIPMAFAFGGLAQIITGVLEFVNGNTFGTVAFSAYGAFWWWIAFLYWTVGAGWIKPPAAAEVGVGLAVWGFFTLGMWISTFRSSKAVWTVFLLLWITFFLLAIGHFAHPHMVVLGGYLGIATGIAALYTGFAEVTNGTYGREVIPLGSPFCKP